MRKMLRPIVAVFIVTAAPIYPSDTSAWLLKTHVMMTQKASIQHPETATFPDFVKRDNESFLGPFHWHDAAPDAVVSPEYIDKYRVTEGRYLKVGEQNPKPLDINLPHPAGVLYWKIADLYQKLRDSAGW